MKIINYYLYNTQVVLVFENHSTLTVHLDRNSGKPYARGKVDTVFLSWVKHAGIRLGIDDFGREWFAHNHIEHGTVVVETRASFAKNQPLQTYAIACHNTPHQVIKNILQQAITQRGYDWSDYNCQTAVNLACNNTKKSDDFNTAAGIFGSIALVGFIGFILKS